MLSVPRRLTVVCTAEPQEPFLTEAFHLFRTLRIFGGTAAESQCVACFVGSVPGRAAERFAELGVLIQIVDRVDDRCPHANKIRMIEPHPDTAYLVALDTDIVVARDFSEHLTGNAFVAKIVDHDPLTEENWRQLFARFGMQSPLARYLTSFHNAETIPYFNSGVLCVPNQATIALREAWF